MVSATAPLLVLSPHFDDAVLSCGGLIAAACAVGRLVLVVTVFTGQPTPETVPARLQGFSRYDVRRGEDDQALAILGAAAERLDFVERAFRPPPLRGLGVLFRAPPVDYAPLTAAVRDLLDRHPGA